MIPAIVALVAGTFFGAPALADTAVIKADRVNIRSEPSLDGEVLAWMKRGETVETQGEARGGFVRIALPAKVAVWVYAPLVDRTARQVKAAEARLRVGPGRNYGELGVLKKGAALTEIRESDGWLQVEPPAGFSAYVGAQFVERSSTAAPRVTAAKTGGILPADGEAVRAPAPAPAPIPAPAPAPAPAPTLPKAEPASAPPLSPVNPQPAPVREVETPVAAPVESSGGSNPSQPPIQYSEKVRVVTRVGKVVRSLEPQSPSYYQLRSPRRGEGMLGFLVAQDPETPIAGLRGKTVRVVAEEYVDPRYPTQVVLRVQSIEETREP
jgi:uncharacterized protein YgiM (DUF1202 family)